LNNFNLMALIQRYSDILVALAVIMIVIMMVIPMPTGLLDVFLALNLTLALVILLVTMYTKEPLDFSVFPSVLLLMTMFRLALNVSTTRLILLDGYAGKMIQQFGAFVVGGNPLVGFIVFLILVIIQFVVITRGAERVAEVAARFTLDAMPGKQMAIDADLNAGLLTEEQARHRRREIQREADFYGAMDGASKFVKGDAIAGIIIVLVNVMGGFAVGMAQKGMTFSEALSKYTLLTVGDGLVSQIPALLLSTATGLTVTRAASEENLGEDLVKQIFSQPKVLAIAAAVLALFAIIPGLPTGPFLLLASLFAYLAYISFKQGEVTEEVEESFVEEEEKEEEGPDSVLNLLQVDPLEIELGYGLLPLADKSSGGDLLNRIAAIRKQLALELGIVLPLIRVRDNMQLPPNEYKIRLKGSEIGKGEILLDHYLAMDPGMVEREVSGINTVEPAFGLPAKWISEKYRDDAEVAGYTVVDPTSVLATHLTELLKRHSYELLGRQETRTLLDHVKTAYPTIVDELVPETLTVGEVQKVLQYLLKEGIPIRDLPTILETLADYARLTRDTEVLTEYVRQALYRQISRSLPKHQGVVKAIVFNPGTEETIRKSIKETQHGSFLTLPPQLAKEIIRSCEEQVNKAYGRGIDPVFLTSAEIRRHVRRLTERTLPGIPVVSFNELEDDLEIEATGTVEA